MSYLGTNSSLVARRLLTLSFLLGALLFSAVPAGADHNDLCRDSATADVDHGMTEDTPPPCLYFEVDAAGGGTGSAGGGAVDADGDVLGAVPTRIDAGAGGAAAAANPAAVGGVMAGLAAAVATLQTLRRRRG